MTTRPVRRIAVVGTGVIGASWTALYLAKGLEVAATDPAPNAEAALRKFVASAWRALTRLGLSSGASQSNLKFTTDLADALASADFVQENGPERVDFKQKLYGQLDELLPPDVIIASSSSGIPMSQIQPGAKAHPERCVIGHPFNPPHLIPLVEIVGGIKTSEETIPARGRILYVDRQADSADKKELPGHVANRLQAALAREVYYLVAEDVLSAADVDTALSWGPGLRWGIMGNMMLNHLGGGPGGIEHFFQQFAGPMVSSWKALGSPVLTPEVQKKLIDSVHAEVGSRTIEELEAESGRDSRLVSSNCAPSVRRRPPGTQSQLSNGLAPDSKHVSNLKGSLQMSVATIVRTEKPQLDLLTETLQSKLGNPERSSNFDLHDALNDVLKDVGMSAADSGGKLTFYGRDPIIPSPHRFGTMAAIGVAAKAVAVAALWRHRTGEGQDIAVDVRKALRRFCGFFELKWETINGRPPVVLEAPSNPFLNPNLFHETRDGRHVVAINIYPKLAARALSLLRCGVSANSVRNAVLQWRADDLENAAAEAGLPFAKVRTFQEFRNELQYIEVLSRMPLITVEKIGESSRSLQERWKEPAGWHSCIRNGACDCRSLHRQNSLATGPMSSTSGGPAIPRSSRSSGTSRLGCVKPYSTTPKTISRSSIAC